MKAIMISIKPKWCAKIMNGEKTIEVRKNKGLAITIQKLIDEYGYADIYVYCSKDKEKLVFVRLPNDKKSFYCPKYNNKDNLNGKVLFKFRCYKVEEIKRKYIYNEYACVVSKEWRETNTCNQEELSKKTCLTKDELFKCLGTRFTAYAIHISNLEIFDRPKELSEFRYAVCPKTNCEYCKYNKTIEGDLYCTRKTLTKAPQNFCYVEVKK